MPKDFSEMSENALYPDGTHPFLSAEEAWFWFIGAQQAAADGARTTRRAGAMPRPCEPGDILALLNRLYRSRLLMWDHILVLRHYGRRGLAPDPMRPKEIRASKLWEEAMSRLEPVFERRGIICIPQNWIRGGRR